MTTGQLLTSPETPIQPVGAYHLPDWLDIMIHPRSAILRIVDTRSGRSAFVLAALSGSLASRGQLGNLPEMGLVGRILLVAIAGPILGVIGVLIAGFVLSVTGTMLGGVGDTTAVIMSVAWSSIPYLIGSLLVAIVAFASVALAVAGVISEGVMVGAILIVGVPVTVYAFVIQVLALSAVHSFSAWRALAAMLLPGVALLAVVFLGSLLGF